MATDSAIRQLAASLLLLADSDFAGYSPLYEQLARSLAADPDTLAFVCDHVATDARWGRVGVLFLASLHDAALANPDSRLAGVYRGDITGDPHACAVELLAAHTDYVANNMRTRSVQTNEVTRSAVLWPALVSAGLGGRQVALVEMGSSAGLNLFADRYRLAYRRGGTEVACAGTIDSTVQVQCDLVGPGDPPTEPPPVVVARSGVDLSPLDVTDPADRRWLRACVWPGSPARSDLLDAAMDLVSDQPPVLQRGDAVETLADMVGAVAPGVVAVVVSSWTMAYLPSAARDRLVDQIGSVARRRDVVLVTIEEPRFTPWLDPVFDQLDPGAASSSAGAAGTPTAVSVSTWNGGQFAGRQVGWCHPHGRWLQWLGPC